MAMAVDSYAEFLLAKTQLADGTGFRPTSEDLPSWLFPFQQSLVEWALVRGRAAIFADTGLGKTRMQLAWADAVARRENGRVLVLTPLAVGVQTAAEAARVGVEVRRSRDGKVDGPGIYVANYEILHKFDPADFVGIVADESSILKALRGVTKAKVIRFALKLRYRLLATATAAPNDWTELGTSSEALGELSASEMLARFFIFDEGKRGARIEDVKQARAAQELHDVGRMLRSGNTFGKLAYRVAQDIAKWRLKGHGEEPFWRWVASWARAARRPSDLGFSDDGYILPPLTERDHVVIATELPPGMLFARPACGLSEEREERRRTLRDRVVKVVDLASGASTADPVIVWCHLNAEGDALERSIPGAVQVAGKHSDDDKEERMLAFAAGEIPVLVTKPKIAGHGMNWQNCARVITFASHSYEQYYQSVRRCWRYGQTRPVTVDVVMTEGETRIRENMTRKQKQAERMFAALVGYMNNATRHKPRLLSTQTLEVPAWLKRQ